MHNTLSNAIINITFSANIMFSAGSSRASHRFLKTFLSEKKINKYVFVTYTIIQSITSSEICALHLTHPSAHTPGAVRSQCRGARGAVGGSVPCSRVSPQWWTIAEIRTHNLGVTSPMLYPLGHDCPVFSQPIFSQK